MSADRAADRPAPAAPRPGGLRAALAPSLGDAVALGALALLAGVRLPDPDLWWHLRAGYDIAAQRAVPREGWYTWTAPNAPWIDHSWLSELAFAGLHALGGLEALALLPAVVVAAVLALVWRRQVREGARPWTAAAVALLAFFLILPAARPRPYLFTLLLLAWLPAIARPPWTWRRAAAVASVLGLWANLHAGFVVALPWLAIRALVPTERPAAPGARRRALGWLSLASLGLLATPYGLDLVRYPLQYGGGSHHADLIVEWASPTFHDPYGGFVALWLAAVLLSAARSAAPRRLADVAVALVFGGLALSAVRHLPVMAVATAPILGRGLEAAAAEFAPRWRSRRTGAIADMGVVRKLGAVVGLAERGRGQAWTVLGIAVAIAAMLGPTRAEGASGVPVGGLPVAAADRLERRAASGEAPVALWNEYAWGGYLIWRLAPLGATVSIDGRADLYGDAVLRDYAAIVSLAPGWEERLDAWAERAEPGPRSLDGRGSASAEPGTRLVVLMPPEELLPRVLRTVCGWSVLHEDADAVLLERPPHGTCAPGAP